MPTDDPTGLRTPLSSAESSPTDGAPGADTAWIAWLRVFAITGVLTIHTFGPNAIATDARATLRGSLAIFADVGAVFAVPVFVMISGALLLDPAKFAGPGTFLRKRAWRLVPPLVFWHVWYLVVVQLQREDNLSVKEIIAHVISGNLYTSLYFFWIVLGLSVLAPVLIPFLASATRRQAIIVGAVAAALPAATIATTGLSAASIVNTAWTWWFPYLGLFILGWALRGIDLRGWWLAATSAGTIALGLLLAWQWHNADAPQMLQTLAPVSYYGASVIVYSCGIYLVFQGLIRADGPVAVFTRPAAVKLSRKLGDATLGVFGLHMTILLLVQNLPVIGGEPASTRALEMVARLALVWLITYVIVLALRRVPVVRKVL